MVDQLNNKGPTTDGKQSNAISDADPSSQINSGDDDPENSDAPKLPDSGNNGIIRPVPLSVLEIGRQTFTALSSGGFAVADTTLHANDPAVTIQGMSMSLGSSQMIVGSSTLLLPTGSANGVLTAAGQTFTPLGRGSILVNGNTLSVDGPATTASGTVMSLASSGLIVDTQTFTFPKPAQELMPNANEILTFASQTFTQLGNGAVAFQGMTLVANGPAATMSLASSKLVIGSQTFALPTPAPNALSSAVVIDGTTLTAGDPAVIISGNTLSLTVGSSGLYVAGHGPGTSTFSVPMTAGESASVDAGGHLVIGNHNAIGGLGPAIMLGFGPTDGASTASATGKGVGAAPGVSANDTTGVLGFTGEGSRGFDPHVMTVVGLALCIGLSYFS